jgi:hypothetical protein
MDIRRKLIDLLWLVCCAHHPSLMFCSCRDYAHQSGTRGTSAGNNRVYNGVSTASSRVWVGGRNQTMHSVKCVSVQERANTKQCLLLLRPGYAPDT